MKNILKLQYELLTDIMLNHLKTQEAENILTTEILKKNIEFYSWVDLSISEKGGYRAQRESQIRERLHTDKVFDKVFLKEWLEIVEANSDLCNILELFQIICNPSKFQFRELFVNNKNFAMEILHKRGVKKYMEKLLREDQIEKDLKNIILLRLEKLYKKVSKLKEHGTTNTKKVKNQFLVEHKTLIFFNVRIEDLKHVLKKASYSYSLNQTKEMDYIFEFEFSIKYLPFLKLIKLYFPEEKKYYTTFYNLGAPL